MDGTTVEIKNVIKRVDGSGNELVEYDKVTTTIVTVHEVKLVSDVQAEALAANTEAASKDQFADTVVSASIGIIDSKVVPEVTPEIKI